MLIKLGCCPDCGAEVGQVHFDHCKLELCQYGLIFLARSASSPMK